MLSAKFARLAVLAVISIVPLSSARAQLITSAAGLAAPVSTITSFGNTAPEHSNGFNAVLDGGAVTMSYEGASGLYFGHCGWGLGSNGSVCNSQAVGLNQGGYVRFAFNGGLVAGAGLMMNYAPAYGAVFLRALDADNNVLAEYDLTADAPIVGNAFQFRGIAFDTPSIATFELHSAANASPMFTELAFTSSVTTVPEPSSIVLTSMGILAIAGAARRRRMQG